MTKLLIIHIKEKIIVFFKQPDICKEVAKVGLIYCNHSQGKKQLTRDGRKRRFKTFSKIAKICKEVAKIDLIYCSHSQREKPRLGALG